MNDGTAQGASPAQQRALENFYFREARLLDERRFLQWLGLLCEDVRYVLPSRVNVQVDNRSRGREEMLGIDRELETEEGMGNPLRDETLVHLTLRAERAYKINAWSEQPPARTRRLVGNIELMERGDREWAVLSNFLLFFARPGSGEVLYSGQRRDRLVPGEGDFRIRRREVVLDYAEIHRPTVGLFF